MYGEGVWGCMGRIVLCNNKQARVPASCTSPARRLGSLVGKVFEQLQTIPRISTSVLQTARC